jgi:hypothetical protein
VVALIWGDRDYGDVSDELIFGKGGNFVSAKTSRRAAKNPEHLMLGGFADLIEAVTNRSRNAT